MNASSLLRLMTTTREFLNVVENVLTLRLSDLDIVLFTIELEKLEGCKLDYTILNSDLPRKIVEAHAKMVTGKTALLVTLRKLIHKLTSITPGTHTRGIRYTTSTLERLLNEVINILKKVVPITIIDLEANSKRVSTASLFKLITDFFFIFLCTFLKNGCKQKLFSGQ